METVSSDVPDEHEPGAVRRDKMCILTVQLHSRHHRSLDPSLQHRVEIKRLIRDYWDLQTSVSMYMTSQHYDIMF